MDPVDPTEAVNEGIIERAVLNETEEGQQIAAGFVRILGDFVANDVRPILVSTAARGGEPQLLVNGLAELLRLCADAIEFPLDHPRAGSPTRPAPSDPA